MFSKQIIEESIGLTVFEDVLSDYEINRVLELATSNMVVGTVVSDDNVNKVKHKDRTCVIEHLSNYEDIVLTLKRKSADICNLPLENQEPLQLIKYTPGGEYKPHFDSFNEGSSFIGRSGNRKATVIFYLNDVLDGGETGFPNINKYIKPKKGSAVLFYNTDDMGVRLNNSLHSGEPVKSGEKWIVTSWIREHKYQP